MKSRLLVALCLSALLGQVGTANALILDASNSISASYDLTPVVGAGSFHANFYVDGPTSTASTSGPYVGVFSEFVVSFYDSSNNLFATGTGGAAAWAPNMGIGALFFPNTGITDPIGRLVLSAINGSTFDITSFQTFASNDPNLTGPVTDFTATMTSVPVSATPLPATWGMMLLGLGVLGFMGYRRRNQTAALAAI
jgi:PEP-CTERM motif-containing protein